MNAFEQLEKQQQAHQQQLTHTAPISSYGLSSSSSFGYSTADPFYGSAAGGQAYGAAAQPTYQQHLYNLSSSSSTGQQSYGMGHTAPYAQTQPAASGLNYGNMNYGYGQGGTTNMYYNNQTVASAGYYGGAMSGSASSFWTAQQQQTMGGGAPTLNASYNNYAFSNGNSGGAYSNNVTAPLNQTSQSFQSATQHSQQNSLQPEIISIDSSTSQQDNSEKTKQTNDGQQATVNRQKTSRWGLPIQTHEIDTFRMTYMPWFKQFSQTNLQNIKTTDTQEQFPAAAASMKLSVKCPDKLSSYIERAFQKCINQQERDFMDAALKRICNACKQRGTLLTKDWDALQLPSLPREGPNYQTINARLESLDVILPQQQSSLQNKTALNQQSVYQSIQLQPQTQLSGTTSANKLTLNSNNSNTINKQPLISNKNSGLFVNNQGEQVSQEDLLKRKQRLEKFNTQLSAPNLSSQLQLSSSSKPNLLQTKSSLGNHHKLQSQYSAIDIDANDLDALTKHMNIIGTCTKLEKSYFRLTSAPDPSTVRPEHILKKSLKLILSKWKNKEADYKYVDDQFRSMRQDLTVQRLENKFCVKVYEAHARIALECADLDQFNQCQTQLHYLYRQGNEGRRIEFLAYKILYQVFIEAEAEVLRMLKTLTFEEKQCEPIQHALKVRQSLASGNFGRFFKLYRVAPNMGGYLMDVFIERHRIINLQKIGIAYIAGNIDLGYLSVLLAFDDEVQAETFLTGLGCKIVQMQDKKKYLICKESLPAIKKAPLKVKVCVK